MPWLHRSMSHPRAMLPFTGIRCQPCSTLLGSHRNLYSTPNPPASTATLQRWSRMLRPQRQNLQCEPSTSHTPRELTREQKQLQVPAPGTDALAKAHSLSNKDRPHLPPRCQRGKYQPRLVCFSSSPVLVTGKIYLFSTNGAWLCSSSPSSPAGPQHSTCPPKAPRGSSPHRRARQSHVPRGLGVGRTQEGTGHLSSPLRFGRSLARSTA